MFTEFMFNETRTSGAINSAGGGMTRELPPDSRNSYASKEVAHFKEYSSHDLRSARHATPSREHSTRVERAFVRGGTAAGMRLGL